jgi:hypothetical protein
MSIVVRAVEPRPNELDDAPPVPKEQKPLDRKDADSITVDLCGNQ